MTTASRDLSTDRPVVQYFIYAVTALAAVAVLVAYRDRLLLAVPLTALVAVLGHLSVIDVAELRLPNRITLPLAAASTVLVGGALVVHGRPLGSLAAIGTGLAFAVVFLLLRFGMGDVKLGYSIGVVASGLGAVLATIVGIALAGAVAAAAILAYHRTRGLSFGYGPCLAVGLVAGMLAAA